MKRALFCLLALAVFVSGCGWFASAAPPPSARAVLLDTARTLADVSCAHDAPWEDCVNALDHNATPERAAVLNALRALAHVECSRTESWRSCIDRLDRPPSSATATTSAPTASASSSAAPTTGAP